MPSPKVQMCDAIPMMKIGFNHNIPQILSAQKNSSRCKTISQYKTTKKIKIDPNLRVQCKEKGGEVWSVHLHT